MSIFSYTQAKSVNTRISHCKKVYKIAYLNMLCRFLSSFESLILSKTKYSLGFGMTGTLFHWWDYKLVQSLWETVLNYHVNLNIYVVYSPAVPLVGISTRETLAHMYQETHIKMFIVTCS